jgi:predicted ATP-binding protein involved in virulence
MIALAADLMSFLIMRFGSMEEARGVVLIDELGAHLHPRWQMRVVHLFRTAFPNLQFIATTHDPLCLRGLEDDEVTVLQRAKGTIFPLAPSEIPRISGLHVDELLTSEVFGLKSTVDPRIEQLFDEYYALLAKQRRTDADQLAINEKRAELDRYEQRGATRRERLALDIADQFFAEADVTPDRDARLALSETAKARLRELWAG